MPQFNYGRLQFKLLRDYWYIVLSVRGATGTLTSRPYSEVALELSSGYILRKVLSPGNWNRVHVKSLVKFGHFGWNELAEAFAMMKHRIVKCQVTYCITKNRLLLDTKD